MAVSASQQTLLMRAAGGPAARGAAGEVTMGRVLCLWFWIVLCMPCAAAPAGADEEAKIAYLISAIETLSEAQFVRNGVAYDAKTAAQHLRVKREQAGTHVRTAQDFITYCASTSSVTGRPYLIRFADGHTVTSANYLRDKLAQFGPAPTAPAGT
jgi:hypothetical protein